jgi:hypothetical protein
VPHRQFPLSHVGPTCQPPCARRTRASSTAYSARRESRLHSRRDELAAPTSPLRQRVCALTHPGRLPSARYPRHTVLEHATSATRTRVLPTQSTLRALVRAAIRTPPVTYCLCPHRHLPPVRASQPRRHKAHVFPFFRISGDGSSCRPISTVGRSRSSPWSRCSSPSRRHRSSFTGAVVRHRCVAAEPPPLVSYRVKSLSSTFRCCDATLTPPRRAGPNQSVVRFPHRPPALHRRFTDGYLHLLSSSCRSMVSLPLGPCPVGSGHSVDPLHEDLVGGRASTSPRRPRRAARVTAC